MEFHTTAIFTANGNNVVDTSFESIWFDQHIYVCLENWKIYLYRLYE